MELRTKQDTSVSCKIENVLKSGMIPIVHTDNYSLSDIKDIASEYESIRGIQRIIVNEAVYFYHDCEVIVLTSPDIMCTNNVLEKYRIIRESELDTVFMDVTTLYDTRIDYVGVSV